MNGMYPSPLPDEPLKIVSRPGIHAVLVMALLERLRWCILGASARRSAMVHGDGSLSVTPTARCCSITILLRESCPSIHRAVRQVPNGANRWAQVHPKRWGDRSWVDGPVLSKDATLLEHDTPMTLAPKSSRRSLGAP